MSIIETMKQALDALEVVATRFPEDAKLRNNLRTALAEMEKEEPVAWLLTYKAESKHGLKQQRQMANLLDEIPDEEAGWTMTKIKSEPLYTHPAPVVPQWQPIETAPKDGTTILVYTGPCFYVAKQNIVPAHWSGWGGGVWENSTSGGKLSKDPTHWMPLPGAPK